MAQLTVMNSSGDSAVIWDVEALAAGDKQAKALVKEAERIVKENQRRGASLFRVSPDRPAERVDVFDPKVEQELLIVPRMAGG